MGESFAVEGKQTYSRLNFCGGRKYGGARLKCLVGQVNNAH